MMTVSGRRIVPGGSDAPSLWDMGFQLAVIPRFCGATEPLWSVLAHSYACADYGARQDCAPAEELDLLLHDAHESVTQDVPKPWKTRSLKAYQRELDQRIYHSLGLALPDPATLKLVKRADKLMGIAEAHLLHPFGTQAVDSTATPDPLALEVVANLLSQPFLRQKNAARAFESRVRGLLQELAPERKIA